MEERPLFPWRAPLSGNWLDRWKGADARVRALAAGTGSGADADATAIDARGLANERLGTSQQLKLEGLARRMLSVAERFESLRHFRLGLISNRTLSLLVNPVRAAGLARGLLLDAVEAPYDSAAVFALGGANVFGGKPIDGVLVHLDESAFPRSGKLLDRPAEDRAVSDGADFLQRIAEAARNVLGVPAVLSTIAPTSPVISSADLATPGTRTRFIARMNAEIALGAENGSWIPWDLDGLAAQIGYENWFDPSQFHQAKTPFKIELCPLVADHLSRIIAAMTGKSARALVFDLDNTVWGGVIGDDGVSGIRLGQNSAEGEAYLAFQRFILELRERGVVLAVCSKNTEKIAREPFSLHPEMLVREEHITVFQANWEDKAANVRAIASALNLGLESLVFVDDNPAERQRIRQELPLVAVPEIGSDPAYFPSIICSSGVFEHLVLTTDDLGRSESYKGNSRRAELQARAANYDEYLQSLHMTLDLSPFDQVSRARISQLINKSNQFNLTTRRYDEEDVRRLAEDRNVLCWQGRLNDVFGNHGMIAVIIVRTERDPWVIDTWLQSCRVLMRGVEETLMNLLAQRARESGIESIIGEYIPTPRNGMVADFFPRLGFRYLEENSADTSKLFSCRTDVFKALKSHIAVTALPGVIAC